MRRAVGRGVALVWALGTLGLTNAAGAASRVNLARPPQRDPVVDEALTRLGGELRAAGFDVTLVDAPAEADVRHGLESAPGEVAPAATIAIVRGPGGAAAVDLWVIDNVTGKAVVRRVEVRPGPTDQHARALAIRAVELLRASLLEIESPPAPVAAEPPVTGPTPAEDVVRWVAATAPPAPSRPLWQGLNLAPAATLWQGIGGLGPAVSPELSLSYGVARSTALRLRWSGPTFGTTVSAAAGSAQVRQLALTAGVVRAWGTTGRWSPMVGAGLGVAWVEASGQADRPYVGQHVQTWTAALEAGAGLALRVSGRTAALLEARVLWAQPTPTVRIGDQEATRVGPTLLVSVGVLTGL